MGTTYTVLLQEEYDWNYRGTSKAVRTAELLKEFEDLGKTHYPRVLAAWDGFIVLDMHKMYPEAYQELLLKYADAVYYWPDSEFNLKQLKELDRPLEKPKNLILNHPIEKITP